MVNSTGQELELGGSEVFAQMGLECIAPLNHVRLIELDPRGRHSTGEHLELDYLIPWQGVCILGEITGRSDVNDIKRKYNRFRQHFDLISGLNTNENTWHILGVPDEKLRLFRNITCFRGLFITPVYQRFDLDLPEIRDIARCYKAEWETLRQYSESIGHYAQYPFFDIFDISLTNWNRPLVLREDAHSLMRTTDKVIAGGEVGIATLYTFEACPYDLLPMARVYRRDMLPDLSSSETMEDYQRPLLPEKLGAIRRNLLSDPDFMFPNSILVVLSANCTYRSLEKELQIPDAYGAVSVIDGQHRLFSYASAEIKERLRNTARIMVTAVQFQNASPDDERVYSARTFVEINQNQTSIPREHLWAIAYDILQETFPEALAAQVILRVNQRRGNMFGFFDTNQTGIGIIQAKTVLTSLKTITNLKTVERLQSAQRGRSVQRRVGYEKLIGRPIETLSDPETLITQSVICLERYFNYVARTFRHDWPKRGQNNRSSLSRAKIIAAFVKLLDTFISEGLDWSGVQGELEKIRDNIKELRNLPEYNSVLLDPEDENIPDAQPSTTDDYRFLMQNREEPVSIQAILAQRRRR